MVAKPLNKQNKTELLATIAQLQKTISTTDRALTLAQGKLMIANAEVKQLKHNEPAEKAYKPLFVGGKKPSPFGNKGELSPMAAKAMRYCQTHGVKIVDADTLNSWSG